MATCDEFVANQAGCFVARFLILPEPQEHQVILCNIDQNYWRVKVNGLVIH